MLAHDANDSGRNEVQVHEWNGQLDNSEGFHLACLNEQNLSKARVANIGNKATKNTELLFRQSENCIKVWTSQSLQSAAIAVFSQNTKVRCKKIMYDIMSEF